MPTNPTPATDSAAELHKLIGEDATATFENDPTYIDSNPTGSASSENLDGQRAGAGQEFVDAVSTKGAATEDDDEDELEDDDDDLDDDEDDLEDGEEDDDEDLDDEDLDDEEDDEEYEDDDEDEDEEDDADEVEASASPHAGTLRADGLLGYEDEAEDAQRGVDRVTGDVERERAQAKLTDDSDEDPSEAYADVSPQAEREEQADSDVVIRPIKPRDVGMSSGYATA